MPAAEDRANCLAAERPDPCWKIHQKLVASIVPFDIGGPLYRVQRLRLTDLTDTARHPKPLAIAPRSIANADYCFPSAKWTWIEFHRGLPLRWHSRFCVGHRCTVAADLRCRIPQFRDFQAAPDQR